MDILHSEMAAVVAYAETREGGGTSPLDLRELLRCKQQLYDGASETAPSPGAG